MQRGRKNAFDNIVPLDVTSTRSRLTPRSSLTEHERAIFTSIAATARHLTATDAPLLAAYSQTVAKTAKLAKGRDVGAWEKAARLMLALARSLRLTPQATSSPQAIGRRRADHDDRRVELAAEMLSFRADDDNDDDQS